MRSKDDHVLSKQRICRLSHEQCRGSIGDLREHLAKMTIQIPGTVILTKPVKILEPTVFKYPFTLEIILFVPL
jgi:hypothetical protein